MQSSSGPTRDLAPIASAQPQQKMKDAPERTRCSIEGPFVVTKLPPMGSSAQTAVDPPAKVPSVKLDAVYKPILRRFRGYFRDKFDQSQNKRSYIHWNIDTYVLNVTKFMKSDLKLPDALQD